MAWRLPQIYEYHKANTEERLLKTGTYYHTSSQHKHNLKPPEERFVSPLHLTYSKSWISGYGSTRRHTLKNGKVKRRKKYENGDIVLNNVVPSKDRLLLLALRLFSHLESIDSIFNKEEMGHAYSNHDLPTAHYTPDNGVSFVLDPTKRATSQEAVNISETPVRNRRSGPSYTPKDCLKPVTERVCTDTKMVLTDERWDGHAGGDGQSQDLTDDCSVSSCPRSFTSSLMGNYSPRSLRERNFVIESDAGHLEKASTRNILPCDGLEKSLPDVLRNDDEIGMSKDLKGSSVLLTPPSEEDSPSLHHRRLIQQSASVEDDEEEEDDHDYMTSGHYGNYNHSNKDSPDDEYDRSIFSDISYTSKSLSPTSRRDWSSGEEDRDLLSPLSRPSSSLDQFPQLLQRRLRECKSVSPDSSKSGTPPPEYCATPEHSARRDSIVLERCDSIDSSIVEIINNGPQQIEKDEVLRFHGIEDELQDLNDEMDDLMSGLSHLKSKCSGADAEDPDLQTQMLLSKQAYSALQRARSRWARRPGSLTPDSSIDDHQSQTGEPSLTWDMSDIQLDGLSCDNESNLVCLHNDQNYVPFSRGVDSDNNFQPSIDKQIPNDYRRHSSHEAGVKEQELTG